MNGGRWIKGLAIVGIVFGALSGRQAAIALLNGGISAPAFVLWFNLIAAGFYIAAGIGLVMLHRWAMTMAAVLAGTTLAVFAAFMVTIAAGGMYEPRVVVAMAVKCALWLALAWGSRRLFLQTEPQAAE